MLALQGRTHAAVRTGPWHDTYIVKNAPAMWHSFAHGAALLASEHTLSWTVCAVACRYGLAVRAAHLAGETRIMKEEKQVPRLFR